MDRLCPKEREILHHYTGIFECDDGTKYISNQIFYETSKTPRIVAFLAGNTFGIFLSHPNLLVADYPGVAIKSVLELIAINSFFLSK